MDLNYHMILELHKMTAGTNQENTNNQILIFSFIVVANVFNSLFNLNSTCKVETVVSVFKALKTDLNSEQCLCEPVSL